MLLWAQLRLDALGCTGAWGLWSGQLGRFLSEASLTCLGAGWLSAVGGSGPPGWPGLLRCGGAPPALDSAMFSAFPLTKTSHRAQSRDS